MQVVVALRNLPGYVHRHKEAKPHTWMLLQPERLFLGIRVRSEVDVVVEAGIHGSCRWPLRECEGVLEVRCRRVGDSV